VRFRAAGAPERGERRVGRREADHPFEVGDRDEQRPVRVSLAQQCIDFQHGVHRIAGVKADAVVDDPLEHRQRAQPHATMLVDDADAVRYPAHLRPLTDPRSRLSTDAESLMAEGAAKIVDGVERLGPAWVVGAVTGIVDAWGRLDPATRTATLVEARVAGRRAAARVAGELRALFALDPMAQRATPLEIVRSLRREATEVVARTGIPEVERDRYDVRSFPDDVYGLVPRSITELGDDELGGALLAWGIGKARVIRERTQP
jgi:hypothetical protein